MIKHIFLFEIKYWLNRWQFYVYIAIAFFLAYLTAGAAGGLFDSGTATVSTNVMINSPLGVLGFVNGFTLLLYFFLPAIFGTAISKDFDSGINQFMYSYPFSKFGYFIGKFSSAFVVALIVMSFVGLGIYAGVNTPGINPELVAEDQLLPYLKTYGLFIIPNLLVFGAVVFILVSITRNITLGYLVVIVLLFQDSISSDFFADLDNKIWGAMLDPFGARAIEYYTEYWTVDEQNNNAIPVGRYIWLNRALWLAIGGTILFVFYRYFQLAQNPITLFKRKEKAIKPIDYTRYGRPVNLNLPDFKMDLGFLNKLKNAWYFSNIHLRYIIRNPAFRTFAVLGVLFTVLTISLTGQFLDTKTYPVTSQMLDFGAAFFFLFNYILIFLFAGFLLHREKSDNMHQLVDATITGNGTLLLSKLLAVVKMVFILLGLIMVSGIGYQLYTGFTGLRLDLYLFELAILDIFIFLPWIAAAFLLHHLIPNKYVGFIVLLAIFIGLPFLSNLGVEQSIYIFNRGGTSVGYSALDGYGSRLGPFFAYRIYWLLLGIALILLSAGLWRRGFTFSIKERWMKFRSRLAGPVGMTAGLFLLAFLAMGFWIYRETNVKQEFVSSKERELRRVDWEKKYKRYADLNLPRITDVNVHLDLVPEDRTFSSRGRYLMVNKSEEVVDTLFLNYSGHQYTFNFDRPADTVLVDKDMNISLYLLRDPLTPGDSLRLDFTVQNEPNTFFSNRAGVYGNGTFLNSRIYPQLGYDDAGELTDDKVRNKYGLPDKERMRPPTDSAALSNTYISGDADWVNFEATISTAPDQIAIAPGYLQREWVENGRRYYHYKMDSKILNFYNFSSGRYEVLKDKWNDVNLEIYYHPAHDYNLDRMMKGLKKGLDYYTKYYSPYQHRQVRILEFPNYYGSFAQSFANTIPYSESVGFIAKVDDSEEGGVDYPFSITAHELAHQWWAHQVIGANVQGATLMSESLSEYSALKVLEKEYGKEKMRIFLKDALDKYLQGRTMERKKEKPLMYNENQAYIHYQKGSLILYALSDYLGEEKFNRVLSEYIDSVAFQNPPYTTSLEFVGMIREATPDSLQYLIKDMFETITLYHNRVTDADMEELDGGKYKISMDYRVRKYRADEQGKRVYQDEDGEEYFELDEKQDTVWSLPLADYIEIGVFDEEGKELYLKKHKIEKIFNEIELTVDEKPKEMGIDPYNKLIDAQSEDNRRKI